MYELELNQTNRDKLARAFAKVKRVDTGIDYAVEGRMGQAYTDNPDIPSLKYVLARDSILVFRNLLSRRSEKLAGFSFLGYINDLLHSNQINKVPKPAPDFFAELDHLLRGIAGQVEIYPETAPAFAKYHGARAAKMRSADLSRMARQVEKYRRRYPSGLDDHIKRLRYRNKLRILRHFNATEFEWSNWQWQIRHIIKDAKEYEISNQSS